MNVNRVATSCKDESQSNSLGERKGESENDLSQPQLTGTAAYGEDCSADGSTWAVITAADCCLCPHPQPDDPEDLGWVHGSLAVVKGYSLQQSSRNSQELKRIRWDHTPLEERNEFNQRMNLTLVASAKRG